jgi:phosphoribosyl-AMP cyclohydrolase / phosphoribosyl-ATP pyrophosphohydrolase
MKKSLSGRMKFDGNGLIPVIIQDDRSLQVLMMAYMNARALERTVRTGEVHFYSRSRKSLWHKGETSGNTQRVKEIRIDCDQDALLIRVDPAGPACHTGSISCFFRKAEKGRWVRVKDSSGFSEILDRIYSVILERKRKPLSQSYVSSLFKGGRDRILKKIGEEAGELIISSKNRKKSEIVWEVADLWFHTLVVMGYHGITPRDIYKELDGRFGKRRPAGKRGRKK